MEKSSSIAPHYLKRIEKFLRYDSPPPDNHPIDTILVLGTSKAIDRVSFDMRIATTLKYAKLYPEARILFSGKLPDIRRAAPHELESDFVEAAVMADEAVRQGLRKGGITLECTSTNTRENILNSLSHLPQSENLLIICSSYVGRRVSLYPNVCKKKDLFPQGIILSLMLM